MKVLQKITHKGTFCGIAFPIMQVLLPSDICACARECSKIPQKDILSSKNMYSNKAYIKTGHSNNQEDNTKTICVDNIVNPCWEMLSNIYKTAFSCVDQNGTVRMTFLGTNYISLGRPPVPWEVIKMQ